MPKEKRIPYWQHRLDLWFFDHAGTMAPAALVQQLRIDIERIRIVAKARGRAVAKREYAADLRLARLNRSTSRPT